MAVSDFGWFSAIKQRNFDVVAQNISSHARCLDPEGNTGLMLAVLRRDVGLVELLAPHEYGIANARGETALIMAVRAGFVEGVQALARLEARFKSRDGLPPLHIAVQRDDPACIRLLLPYSADQLSTAGESALDVAVTGHKLSAALCLLSDSGMYGPDDVTRAVALANSAGDYELAGRLQAWLASYLSSMGQGQASTAGSGNPPAPAAYAADRARTPPVGGLSGSQAPAGGHPISPHVAPYNPTASARSPRMRQSTLPGAGSGTGASASRYPASAGGVMTGNVSRQDETISKFQLTPNPLSGQPRTGQPLRSTEMEATLFARPPGTDAFEYLRFKKCLAEAETRPASRAVSRSSSALTTTLNRSNSGYKRSGSRGNRLAASIANPPHERLAYPTTNALAQSATAYRTAGTPERSGGFYDSRTLRPTTHYYNLNVVGGTQLQNYSYVDALPDQRRTHARYGPIAGYDAPNVERSCISTAIYERAPADDVAFGQFKDPSLTDLMKGAKLGKLSLVQARAAEQAMLRSATGRTALIYAAQRNFVALVEVLRTHEARAYDDLGYTALMYAAAFGHRDCVQELVDFEAGYQRELDGATALMAAAANGHAACVRILAPAEAGISAQNGTTALMLAIKYNRTECVQILLPYELGAGGDSWRLLEEFCITYGREEYLADIRYHLRYVQ
ncbi:Ankyrin repeat protein 1 [Giardia muris]|uniref:Ankyrin repeat protein 1 n=1 Tax=Giardia muris TaxID=5742 RepID=A0A4Z1T5M5_GIAMU|nr:Ankyrin repeat protein 1 [Giardia muris]|eukprot:TNJ27829.1 Ankyrin repeat protein 1 [Giardia muris]